MLSEYTVAWAAADSNFAIEMANAWITSDDEKIASAGWATWGSIVAVKKNEDLDLEELTTHLLHIEKYIHNAPNRVRYTMNGFVIAVGCYVPELTEEAQKIGKNIGKVKVNMGGTACKVPEAVSYIQKVVDNGRVGKKRKMAKC